MQENKRPKFDLELYRSCDNKVAGMFCTQEGCNIPALVCGDLKCACMLEKHKHCQFRKIQSLFECLLKQRVQISEKLKKNLNSGMQMFDKLLQEVSAKRRDYLCFVEMFGLDKNSRAIMIYADQRDYDSITGDLISKAEKEIAQKKRKNLQLYQTVNIYAKLQEKMKILIPQMQKMTNYYRSDQSKITDFGNCQIQKFFQKKVSHFQLLYRGSQNDFSADAYHKKCDQIEDNLLILQTEFGKKIGGFTPLKRNQSGQTVTDQSGTSFMFSLSLNQNRLIFYYLRLELLQNQSLEQIQKQYSYHSIHEYNLIFQQMNEKYFLVNKAAAIAQYTNEGSNFGCNYDLKILDSCHTNGSNKCDFPVNYNNGKYSRNQQAYAALIGQTKGYNFKVKQYEVFKVHWK